MPSILQNYLWDPLFDVCGFCDGALVRMLEMYVVFCDGALVRMLEMYVVCVMEHWLECLIYMWFV